MAAIMSETRTIDTGPPVALKEHEVSDGMRIARYCTLDELPGLIFGVMTVGYIVLSLAGLKL